jgi:hypothetical protein
LRFADFSDDVRDFDEWALGRSGLERLHIGHLARLRSIDGNGLPWLLSVRLPSTLRTGLSLYDSWRVQDLTCGSHEIMDAPRLRRFRSTSMRGVFGEWQECSMSRARITGEIAASAGRAGRPAIPC